MMDGISRAPDGAWWVITGGQPQGEPLRSIYEARVEGRRLCQPVSVLAWDEDWTAQEQAPLLSPGAVVPALSHPRDVLAGWLESSAKNAASTIREHAHPADLPVLEAMERAGKARVTVLRECEG